MSDRLAALLKHFSLSARTFQTGSLCGINRLDGTMPYGQLHLIRRGEVALWHGNRVAELISEPCLLFYPRPMAHHFVTDAKQGAEFVCAHVSFEGGAANPIVAALPAYICLPLSRLVQSLPVLELLFSESEAQYCGRQAMLDRLFEILLIQLLRVLMEEGHAQVGLLAGFAHPHLRRAIVAMHDEPERNWSVEGLAQVAGMSRSVFSNLFRDLVGETPASYLQRWRIGLVQKWLAQGRPLKLIVEEAGYSNESALSRAFKSQTGLSPREWLKGKAINPPVISMAQLQAQTANIGT